MDLQKLKFPIGVYTPNKYPENALLDQWIKDIEEFPSQLENITKKISMEVLNWKYRPDGWTVKQVVHHCTDSHMNGFIRFKLALTEEMPTIRSYHEDRWAKLVDAQEDNLSDSLKLLKGLHKKWVILLRGLTYEQLKLEFVHPEHGKRVNLAENIGVYAWHGNHHLAHVKNGITSGGKYN